MHYCTSFALVLGLLLGGVGLMAQTDTLPQPELTLKNVSYAYGYNFGNDLSKSDEFTDEERNAKYVIKGIKDGLMKLDTAKLNRVVSSIMRRIDGGEPRPEKAAPNMAYNLGYSSVGNIMNLLELTKQDFHYGFLKKGYLDFTKGKAPRFTEEERENLLSRFFQEKQALVQERYDQRMKVQAKENLQAAKEFLLENSKKAGIQTTASGLQYQIIKEGTGPNPGATDRVKVHYTGTFVDGQTFDSSIERGEPSTFGLNEVIQGWQEGIPMMKVGGRYRFFVPPNLGYGTNVPPSIPPNAVLIFDVELLEIVNDGGLLSTKGEFSYSYGFMLSNSLNDLGFSPPEREVDAFMRGYEKGFSVSKEDLAAVELAVRERIESRTPATTPEDAKAVAYNIGLVSSASIAQQLDAHKEDFDARSLAKGYQDAYNNASPQYTEKEMTKAVNSYFEPKQAAMQDRRAIEEAQAAAANKAKGKAFLEENAQKDGVVSLPSGLQYQVIKEGTGNRALSTSNVTTHYTGTLLDGTVFDSSVERGEPATFRLNQVIQGWQEGIPLMKKGAKYRFFIPSQLAYGDRSMGSQIPAGSLLIFEVELLEIE